MAEKKKFVMLIGMKEHPETGVLLFPGDVFSIDPQSIMKPPEFGGWLQRSKDPAVQKPEEPVQWVLLCAAPVSDSTPEGLTMRDEPSQIIGVNISERDYLLMERAREGKGNLNPDVSVANSSKGVAGVRRRG